MDLFFSKLRKGFHKIASCSHDTLKLIVRQGVLLARICGRKEIKFGIPEDLDEMMLVLTIQLRVGE